MKVDRIRRLLELMRLLQLGSGYNANSLATECGVCRRTVFRDLDLLRRAGMQVEFDEERQRYCMSDEMRVLPPTNFTTEEALALLVLCRRFGNGAGAPLQKAAANAALKLESSLPSQLRDELADFAGVVSVAPQPGNPLLGREAIYQQLLRATADRRCVRIDYDSLAEKKVLSLKLSPYRLLFSRHAWYVIGRSSLHRAPRTFNLGRIQSVETLKEKYKIPRGFSTSRYLRNAWHLIPEPGKDQQIVLRFQPLVARNVAEVIWHKTQRVRFNNDGTLTFRVTVSGLWEISWWVQGYGDQVEVLRPKKLREIITERARRMLVSYASSSNGTAKIPAP